MFEKLAQFRPFGPRRVGGVATAIRTTVSNDNQPGFRRSAGQRRIPKPVLVCHWILTDGGRLACHWEVDDSTAPRDGRSRAAVPPLPHQPPRRAAG
ncbi:hypothetical protein JQ557_30095 [Bradyrhizobium sp. U87765 SZCCT0131]|uniref:hypothetical protein n=1 Tax=unclassified Bradyrhizobium TaxID=2631580 RepID=UPI001BA5011D|nr:MULTISPECIES: hypothetical protein [unclassified Bradyrhizobium]MBR1222286.1 hypothetical protein [Bradyrhizobium sp. U87765 SZCCT0131]MBR1264230.1 hypothetical protein [Bradyrhizobium sp. U87765 SZCCT0134]MBR1307987.1 hypothetical protein [Bradyrhizobium sp. U87765 SZCCT0110]MBR1320480.1 hypothetical protein [Bradyrhizobium sp. U87765 SZCCT0109]MBR1348407.1 hypothetical protein [Bradyrhizobium sp. U87765 SZCCT0048]